MRRSENIFRILLAGIFAVCAIGAWSRSDWPSFGLFLFVAVLFVWRSNR